MSRLAIVAVIIVITLLGSAGDASASLRSGGGLDATGDSSGGGSQDITAAAASFDDETGAITLTVTMAAVPPPGAHVEFTLAQYQPSLGGCYAANPLLVVDADTDDPSSATIATPNNGPGAPSATPMMIDGATITITGINSRGSGWRCTTLAVTPKGGGAVLDELAPFYFAGYGPDTDADGLVDNQDTCPTIAGPAPSGCPPAPPQETVTQVPPAQQIAIVTPDKPTTPKCRPPNERGHSLAHAKKAFARAHCTVGHVTRPKHLRSGYKLVIATQQKAGHVIRLALRAVRE